MKVPELEKLYMLRLWQEKESWRASLKPVGNKDEAATYFHTLESLTEFLKTKVSHHKGEL
jgi:hypothetical protein